MTCFTYRNRADPTWRTAAELDPLKLAQFKRSQKKTTSPASKAKPAKPKGRDASPADGDDEIFTKPSPAPRSRSRNVKKTQVTQSSVGQREETPSKSAKVSQETPKSKRGPASARRLSKREVDRETVANEEPVVDTAAKDLPVSAGQQSLGKKATPAAASKRGPKRRSKAQNAVQGNEAPTADPTDVALEPAGDDAEDLAPLKTPRTRRSRKEVQSDGRNTPTSLVTSETRKISSRYSRIEEALSNSQQTQRSTRKRRATSSEKHSDVNEVLDDNDATSRDDSTSSLLELCEAKKLKVILNKLSVQERPSPNSRRSSTNQGAKVPSPSREETNERPSDPSPPRPATPPTHVSTVQIPVESPFLHVEEDEPVAPQTRHARGERLSRSSRRSSSRRDAQSTDDEANSKGRAASIQAKRVSKRLEEAGNSTTDDEAAKAPNPSIKKARSRSRNKELDVLARPAEANTKEIHAEANAPVFESAEETDKNDASKEKDTVTGPEPKKAKLAEEKIVAKSPRISETAKSLEKQTSYGDRSREAKKQNLLETSAKEAPEARPIPQTLSTTNDLIPHLSPDVSKPEENQRSRNSSNAGKSPVAKIPKLASPRSRASLPSKVAERQETAKPSKAQDLPKQKRGRKSNDSKQVPPSSSLIRSPRKSSIKAASRMKKWTENRDLSSEAGSSTPDAEVKSAKDVSTRLPAEESDLASNRVPPSIDRAASSTEEIEKARANVNASSIDQVVGAFQAEFERSALSGGLNRTDDAVETMSSDVEEVETPNIPGLTISQVRSPPVSPTRRQPNRQYEKREQKRPHEPLSNRLSGNEGGADGVDKSPEKEVAVIKLGEPGGPLTLREQLVAAASPAKRATRGRGRPRKTETTTSTRGKKSALKVRITVSVQIWYHSGFS